MKGSRCHLFFLAIGALCVAFAVDGCALTSKAEVVDVRYFSPERVESRHGALASNSAPSASGHEAHPPLNLGRVTSAANLRERIAYRNSGYERGYYDELRWTERPDTYVRRELARSLFEVHGLQRVLGGAAPTLDIEVIAFDDLRLEPGRAARVQLGVILYENAGVIFEETFTVDRKVLGEQPRIEEVIAAMSTALDAAAEAVACRVQAALMQRPVAGSMSN